MLTLISAKTGLKTQTLFLNCITMSLPTSLSYLTFHFNNCWKILIVKPDPHTKLFIYVQNMLTK